MMGAPASRLHSASVVLYGATGYTGQLVLDELQRLGLNPILAGRDSVKVSALAATRGLRHAAVSVSDSLRLTGLLEGACVLLNTAGPFSRTAVPLMLAALKAGVHYLDVTGEVDVFSAAVELDRRAREAGVMLMPGVGFDVVPSDCLAVHLWRRLPEARSLRLGIFGLRHISRGSARTLVQHLSRPIRARRNGRLVPVPEYAREHRFDLGDGLRPACAVDWGDIVTAYYSTGISDVTTYFEATPALRAALLARDNRAYLLRTPPVQACLELATNWLPPGPTPAQRSQAHATLVAEAESESGARVCSRLQTPEVYAFTAQCAARVVAWVVQGNWEPGFQTPARVFGSEFILRLPGVVRHDLAS